MASNIKRTPGGAFGRTQRFQNDDSKLIMKTPAPGEYNTTSDWSEQKKEKNVFGPKYFPKYMPKAEREEAANKSRIPKDYKGLPNPNKDRTAWVLGTTRDEMAYYSNVSEMNGPAKYEQSVAPIKNKNHRVVFGRQGKFGKNARGTITRQYLSKAHNVAYLCTEGPGPKYTPETSQIDLVRNKPPKWVFSPETEFNTTRSSFLDSSIKGGYLYRAKPATQEILEREGTHKKGPGAGPTSYSPNMKAVKKKYNTQPTGREQRFGKIQHKRFISKKHTRGQVGNNSPGPVDYYQGKDMFAKIKRRTRNTQRAGTWCP